MTPRVTSAKLAPAPTKPVTACAIAALAVRSLDLEVATYPKPGLVSHVDSGSHTDIDAETFRRSARALAPFFADLATAGGTGCGMGRLRVIGLAGEAVMLKATSGINTHRGAIFGLGLLCAAAGARAAGRARSDARLGAIVRDRWAAEILAGPVLLRSHGEKARRRHGAGGARAEAAAGFQSVENLALPALRAGRLLAPADDEAARVQACFALMAAVEDTNLLHRGGAAGLAFVQGAAADFLRRGGVGEPAWRATAVAIHEAVVARRLSPGGSADLLAMALFVRAMEEPVA